MKMGFYERKWSTLLKGPGATRFKERWEVTRVESLGGAMTKFAFVDAPRLIQKAHTISKFFDRWPYFLKVVTKICSNCVKIIFNQLTQDMKEIETEDGVVKQLADFWNKVPKNVNLKEAERTALMTLAAVDDEEEKLRYRPEYNEVEAIVLEAKNVQGDHEKFMDWLRTRVKKRDELRNVLERYAWRSTISLATKRIFVTESLRNRLHRLLEKISEEREDKKIKALSAELQVKLIQICKEIKAYFRESYLVRERAILMILKVLYIAESVDEYLKKMEEQSYLPKIQTEQARERLKEVIVDEIGKEFNKVLAQEFRIVIHDLEVEKTKERKLAKAA